MSAFEGGDGFFERLGRRRAEASVVGSGVIEEPVLASAPHFLDGLREDGGRVENRRVHRALMSLGMKSGMDCRSLIAHGHAFLPGANRKAGILTATRRGGVSPYNCGRPTDGPEHSPNRQSDR